MRRAFTLVELMLVISIMGILLGIAGFTWATISARSRDNSRKADLSQLKNMLQQYFADSRQYPVFDLPASGEKIYSATWQLSGSAELVCLHSQTQAKLRLSNQSLGSLPKDPKDTSNYSQAGCSSLSQKQQNRYLYISGPTVRNETPSLGEHFALLATLENQRDPDIVADSLNPLKTEVTNFGNWYLGSGDNYTDPVSLNANYLATNSSLN